MKMHHWYHLYCGGAGPWEEIVREHFDALQSSGLYLGLSSLNIGVVGPRRRRQQAYLLLDSIIGKVPGPDFHVWCEDEGWEQFTLTQLWRCAQVADDTDMVFYAHTKGAANPSDGQRTVREALEHLMIERWQVCLNDLMATSDVVTPYRMMIDGRNRPVGANNYWWARMSWIATLDQPRMDERYDAERWIIGPNVLGDEPT